MPLNLDDLDDDTRKRLGLKQPRKPKEFKIEDVRREALSVLNLLRHLTSAQRRRVLEHSLKVNDV